MTDYDLNIQFKEAVKRVNEYLEPFPPDFLLRLYAYYKKATNDFETKNHSKTIVDAFKTNALLQVQSVTSEEAKKKYVQLVNAYFLYRKSDI